MTYFAPKKRGGLVYKLTGFDSQLTKPRMFIQLLQFCLLFFNVYALTLCSPCSCESPKFAFAKAYKTNIKCRKIVILRLERSFYYERRGFNSYPYIQGSSGYIYIDYLSFCLYFLYFYDVHYRTRSLKNHTPQFLNYTSYKLNLLKKKMMVFFFI